MPKTILPDSRVTPRFAGLCTFGRFPRLEDVRPEHRPLDWAVLGVPFDSGVTFRPGARFGPRAVREASQYLKPFHLAHAVNVCERLSIADAGDAPVKPYDLKANLDAVAAWATALPDPATKLLAIGGDHSIAYANLRATFERRGRPKGGLALVHFDAHLDTVDAVWDSKWGHASPFRRAIEDGLVDPKAMISVGVRGPLNRGDDLDFARSAGVTLVPADDVHAGKGAAALGAFARALGTREAYVTFDIDAFDQAFAPGTGTPCPGGFSAAQGFALLRSLAGVRVAGADVVEVLPDRDVAGTTALLAAHVALEVLALDVVGR